MIDVVLSHVLIVMIGDSYTETLLRTNEDEQHHTTTVLIKDLAAMFCLARGN